MRPEIAVRAFEPFATTRSDGFGLGLARVADFVRRCDGEATILSTPGSGATVVLRLPDARLQESGRHSGSDHSTDEGPSQ